MDNSIIITLSLVVGKQITLHKKTCSFFFQTLNMWTLDFRIYFGRFCHVSGDSVTLWYAILSQVRLYSKTSIKQTTQLSGHPLLQLVSVLCVDPDFVGHDSTASGGAGSGLWSCRVWGVHDCTSKEICQSFINHTEHARNKYFISVSAPYWIFWFAEG